MKHALVVLLSFLVTMADVAAFGDQTRLSDLDLSGMTQGYGKPTADAGVSGAALAIAGEDFERGIGTHAKSSWKLTLAGKGVEFRAKVGVQDGNPGVVAFIVRGDGKELFNSGTMCGGDSAKDVRVALAGVKELELYVSALGDITSDHVDWIDPVIVHNGAPLPAARPPVAQEPLLPDAPGEPANAAAKVEWNEQTGALRLTYDGKLLFEGQAKGAALSNVTTRKKQAITQTLTLTGRGVRLEGVVFAGDDAIAAETKARRRGTSRSSAPPTAAQAAISATTPSMTGSAIGSWPGQPASSRSRLRNFNSSPPAMQSN